MLSSFSLLASSEGAACKDAPTAWLVEAARMEEGAVCNDASATPGAVCNDASTTQELYMFHIVAAMLSSVGLGGGGADT